MPFISCSVKNAFKYMYNLNIYPIGSSSYEVALIHAGVYGYLALSAYEFCIYVLHRNVHFSGNFGVWWYIQHIAAYWFHLASNSGGGFLLDSTKIWTLEVWINWFEIWQVNQEIGPSETWQIFMWLSKTMSQWQFAQHINTIKRVQYSINVIYPTVSFWKPCHYMI